MSLIIYPNPNTGKFYIELKSSKCKPQKIVLFNSASELVFSGELEWGKNLLIDLIGVQSEIYTLFMKNDQLEFRYEVIIRNPSEPIEASVKANIDIEFNSLD